MFASIEVFAHDILRAKIAASRGQYIGIVFVKRDGTLRRMTAQQGNDAKYMRHTERGEQASLTFHANNPHMLRVRDVGLQKQFGDGAKAWRTVDLATVCTLRIGGQTLRLRTYREALANVQRRLEKKTA